LSALRRIASGSFAVDDAYDLDRLRAGDFAMLPLRAAIASLPTRRVDDLELVRVLHGNAISAGDHDASDENARVALVDDDQALVAVAEREGNELRPKLVLRDA
jgi:tRNA U55 pseudouridine synthase TruB